MDRKAAQVRIDRILSFSAELADLQKNGVLTLDEAQRQAVARHHQQLSAGLTAQFDLDLGEGQRQMSLGMRIASVLGAIALCAALFLFFYRIWGLLGTSTQVLVLAAAPCAGLGLTELAYRKDRAGHFVFVAAVIACASIVMNVVLIGDIFAMRDSPLALAAWAAFAIAIGHTYGLRLPIAAGIGLATAFVAGFVLTTQGIDWKAFPQRPELLMLLSAVPLTTALFVRPWFQSAYRLAGWFVLLAALLALSIDEGLSVFHWNPTFIRAFYQILGFLVSAGAIAIGLTRDWSDSTYIGAASFVVFLYTKFYQWWWDWMPAYLFFLIVGLTAIAMIVTLQRLRARAAPVTT